jgi:uncharacterized protein DUF4266
MRHPRLLPPPRRAPVRRSVAPRCWARVGLWLAVLSALSAVAGCGHAPPIQPWQREYLSKRAMRFDADPLEARFRQHMFGSREGADGGYGQPGGGCGCN